jgi:hypothetical protein
VQKCPVSKNCFGRRMVLTLQGESLERRDVGFKQMLVGCRRGRD